MKLIPDGFWDHHSASLIDGNFHGETVIYIPFRVDESDRMVVCGDLEADAGELELRRLA